MKLRKSIPLLGLLTGVVVIATACSGITTRETNRVSGSGTIASETRDVAGFDRIVLSGEGRVIVTPAGAESLVIETDDNLLRYIESTVESGTLTLATRARHDIDPSDEVVYRVGVETLTGIELLGAGTFELGEWTGDDAAILLLGAGDIRVDRLTTDRLDVTLAGAGNIRLAGEASRQTVTLPGAGNLDAGALRSGVGDVRATGAVNATLWVTDSLDISVTGVGNVEYYGSPDLSQRVTGLGSIESLGAK